MFGDSLKSQFTLNMPRQYFSSKVAVWTTVVNPLSKYALTMTPVALSLEELLPTTSQSNLVMISIRTILVLSTLVVALSVPFFGLVMALLGSIFTMLVALILPCASYLSIKRRSVNFLQLSNNQAYPGFHDEVDIEFLGNIDGQPYILQTNVYVRGSGDGRIIGREVRFQLWFDPTADFHHYAILWNPDEIIFFVDDVPIRRYARKVEAMFPERQMWMYGSIWDASAWATENGKYKTDYRYQPFVARFTGFNIGGCSEAAPSGCHPVPSSLSGEGLSPQQYAAMQWAQTNHMIYDYCEDSTRDHSLTPQC